MAFSRSNRSEGFFGALDRSQHLLRPCLLAPYLMMGREDVTFGRYDPDSLILVLLALDGTKEIATRIFGLPNLIEVNGHRNKGRGYFPDDVFVGEWARTEPGSIPSATLQRIISRNPEKERALLNSCCALRLRQVC